MNLAKMLGLTILSIIGFWLAYKLSPILTPFIIAGILAYLLDPLVQKLIKLNVPRTLAVGLVFMSGLLVFLLLLLLVVPPLEKQILYFIEYFPQLILWVQVNVVQRLTEYFHLEGALNADALKAAFTQHWQQAGNVASVVWVAATKSGHGIAIFIINLFLVPVVTFYLLRDWDKLIKRIKDLFPRSKAKKVNEIFGECDEVLSAFFRGQLLVMLALGVYYTVGLWLIGVNVGLLLGVLIGILSLVPYLGFMVGILLALITTAVQFHDGIHLFYVALLFGLGTLLENMFLIPVLVGDRIGLHPVMVIFAILAGGQLFGFFGVLLALPVAAVIMVLLRHTHRHYIDSDFYAKKTSS